MSTEYNYAPVYIGENTIAERFMRYVRIDTQSDGNSNTHPSTEKQKNLSKMLFNELGGMGLSNVFTDEFGYVYATLPSNTTKNVPVICFCSHVDTTSDCSGTDVKPIYHQYYDGNDIILPDDNSIVINTENSPYLKNHIGGGVITASGLTLLGADDKSGIAAIMEAVHYFLKNPTLKHGDIRILFTPDEEIGKGTAKLDMNRLNAQFGYTLDGGEAGCVEDETFSADGAIITVDGISVHPGYANNVMVNALKVVAGIVDELPKNEWCPERTDGKIGFVHPISIGGIAEQANIQFIVRDFDDEQLANHHLKLKNIAENVVAQFPGAKMTYQQQEQYRNMKKILDLNPEIVANAEAAITRCGLTVKKDSIRGGTDGSRLSYMGLPCPNIFTGMQNIHSKKEWIGVKDMALASATIVHLCCIWEENA